MSSDCISSMSSSAPEATKLSLSKKISLTLSVLLLCNEAQAPYCNAQSTDTPFEPSELIVGYNSVKDRLQSVQDLSATINTLSVRNQKAEKVQITPLANDAALKLRIDLPAAVMFESKNNPAAELRGLEELAAQIRKRDPRVKYVHPNWILRIDPPSPGIQPDLHDIDNIIRPQTFVGPPNDPLFVRGLLWHYEAPPMGMNAVGAWRLATGDHEIVVAVIDTGIIFNQPDIKSYGNVLPGYNFVSKGSGRSADATDTGDACPPRYPNSTWHGTHVAGTIGAVGSNNGRALPGINWSVSILPIRVNGPCGSTIADTADALLWAAGLPVPNIPNGDVNKRPAHVINISLGAMGECTEERVGVLIDAIEAARVAGSTVVVAAGNDAIDVKEAFPGGCKGVIAVAASDIKGHLAHYSNYGGVTIMAPGGDMKVKDVNGFPAGVWSVVKTSAANRDGIEIKEGTSQAAPHVSGAIALALAAHPTWRGKPDLITSKLTASATPAPAGACAHPCGAGQLNAMKLLQLP
jgi:subtilisin family serine protease